MIYQRKSLAILTAIAAIAFSATSSADNIIGSPGSGWQTWTTDNLNDNLHPFWDSRWGSAYNRNPYPDPSQTSPSYAEKNAGFCLTSTGDCQGVGSGQFAPGALPYWGKTYDSSTDTKGDRDSKVYFHSSGKPLIATLLLNTSLVPTEINEFGWFETNAKGDKIISTHILFQGTGDNNGTYIPDPVGKTVTFTPSKYYGYYYNDVSEQSDSSRPIGSGYGCYVYTLWGFTEPRCLENTPTGGQGDHDLVVFKENTKSNITNYWIAAEDPVDCLNYDGDCNLTLVKVSPEATTPKN